MIDPALPGVQGPMTIEEWSAAISLTVCEISGEPLSQTEMLNLFAQCMMKGQDLQGFVFVLERGISPVSDIPGSGFRIAADPLEGIAAFVNKEVQRLFKEQAKMTTGGLP